VSEATRRALRTLAQLVIALPTLVPVLHTVLDWLAGVLGADNQVVTWGVAILAGVTAVTGLINSLEDRGLIPSYLKAPVLPPGQDSTAGRTWPS
jgi:hypothetical protein